MAAVDIKPPPEWPWMPTRLISIPGIAIGSCSMAAFFIGQPHSHAGCPTRTLWVPFGAAGIAAAVAHGHDDHGLSAQGGRCGRRRG